MTVHQVAPPSENQQGSDSMGEIRVDVKLINAVDEANARGGIISTGEIHQCMADAMVDTGAICSVIPTAIADQLNVQIRERATAQYADGRRESVGVTGPIIFELMGRSTLEEALVLGDQVLIGQTVLEKLDLLADCSNRRLIPNPKHPDQPIFKV